MVCWLGGRKGIRPVKKQRGGVLVWLSVWSNVHTCIWPSLCHCHSLSLASVKSRLVLPFWCRLTWVVPEKGPLNGCVSNGFDSAHGIKSGSDVVSDFKVGIHKNFIVAFRSTFLMFSVADHINRLAILVLKVI